MNNKEIDVRLLEMAKLLPKFIKERTKERLNKTIPESQYPTIREELEIMNMSLMTTWTMLGEIAKRLPQSDAEMNQVIEVEDDESDSAEAMNQALRELYKAGHKVVDIKFVNDNYDNQRCFIVYRVKNG